MPKSVAAVPFYVIGVGFDMLCCFQFLEGEHGQQKDVLDVHRVVL